MVFPKAVDFFVAWLSYLLADTLVLFCSIYMWQNEGACWGVVQRRENFSLGKKISLCIRCNPKLCIESQAFVLSERTLYLCERMIWVYWDLSLVRVSLHHLYSLHLSVKFLLVAAHRFRLKVELDKFLVLSCVCVSIFLSTLLRSFLLFGEVFQRSIIFSQLIVWIATRRYFPWQIDNRNSANYLQQLMI